MSTVSTSESPDGAPEDGMDVSKLDPAALLRFLGIIEETHRDLGKRQERAKTYRLKESRESIWDADRRF